MRFLVLLLVEAVPGTLLRGRACLFAYVCVAVVDGFKGGDVCLEGNSDSPPLSGKKSMTMSYRFATSMLCNSQTITAVVPEHDCGDVAHI